MCVCVCFCVWYGRFYNRVPEQYTSNNLANYIACILGGPKSHNKVTTMSSDVLKAGLKYIDSILMHTQLVCGWILFFSSWRNI